MKVFMSWSGLRSKLTAELLHDWIKCVIQAAQPWISSRGIERGALWFSEINNELKDTAVGIICLTQENKSAPWILFESGALAKGLSSNRVCTFLIDLQAQELQPPLAQFNHTFPTKESVWSLVTTLNNGLDSNRLDLPVLQRVFETYWPQFESSFTEILASNPPVTVVAPREEKDILAEILETTRSMSNRVRRLEERNNTVSGSNDFGRPIGSGVFTANRPRFYGGGGEVIPDFDSNDKDSISYAIQFARSLLRRGDSTEAVGAKLKAQLKITETQVKSLLENALLMENYPTAKPD